MFWSLLTSIHLLPAFFAGIAPLEHADDAGKHTSDTRAAVSVPRLICKVEPEYSEEARNSGHQGTVVLYLEVDPSGKPRNLRVIRKLGLGLDEKAIEAVGKWKFLPGYKDGGPVTSAATVEVNFRLLPDMNSLIERARKGEIAAQFELGLMYYRGEGGAGRLSRGGPVVP